MTQTQAAALARALQRAHARGLAVTGKGTRHSDGATVYTVTSACQPGRWHLVLLAGSHLVCDCPAGQRGVICQHQALVRERIKQERQAQRIADQVIASTVAAPASRGTRPTAIALTHPGDTALMRRSNRPFSLLKV